MAAKYKTPGVYIEEVSVFPKAVTPVATAVPAFIGYTEKAIQDDISLVNKPTRISSFFEYKEYFGGAFQSKFELLQSTPNDSRTTLNINDQDYVLDFKSDSRALMYHSIKFFYDNGGGPCYIVSVGTYNEEDHIVPNKEHLLGTNAEEGGLKALEKEQEPTMVVVPDAVNLIVEDYHVLCKAVLKHCNDMQNRIAIFDIYEGFKERNNNNLGIDIIKRFRDGIGTEYLKSGVAYYPWLHTSVVNQDEITFENLDIDLNKLSTILSEETAKTAIQNYLQANSTSEENKRNLNNVLLQESEAYRSITAYMLDLLNLLPVASAIAGVYSKVDSERGVWKAPANVQVHNVARPAVTITHEQQDNLNADTHSGKSINAIREFSGTGIRVWGARTLDGNSNDWRYINVRRTLIFIEESIRLALQPYVFEPNNANTWVSVKGMIENFLMTMWRDGALAGAKPDDAFGVRVGLGQTMTSIDILEGRMLVTVVIAVIRPAEFIVLNFIQQMDEA